jgi:hypothetical protein
MRTGTIVTLLLAGFAGCSDGIKKFPVAPASGVLLCEGEPVKMAQVNFEPIATGNSANIGKPAFDFTDEQGRFVLSTYGDGDGAVIGKHNVRVAEDSQNRCNCVARLDVTLMQVDVKSDGPNEFKIELTKKVGNEPPPRQSRGTEDDE